MQQAPSLVPTAAAKYLSRILGGESFGIPLLLREFPNIPKLERPKWFERSFIYYRHLMVACDKIDNHCEIWKPKHLGQLLVIV